MPLTSGARLGPYEILAPIGAGGMGEVYKARDTRLDRIVALKVAKIEFSERFEREARAVAALNHSNICTLHDVGPNYLVMEYIAGTPIKGPMPLNLALKCGAQICDALDAAHKKGLTHRELKPANILLTKSGIKLLDFGLAKQSGPLAATDATQAMTEQGAIVGTLSYMSPEQLQSKPVDARSDIFSFGIVMYEMLTGRKAFEGSSPASVIAAIMERPAPSVAEVTPAALERMLKKCLAKDPEERWQSAKDLKDELEWIATTPRVPVPVYSRRLLPWIAAVTGLTLVALLGWMRTPKQAPPSRTEVSFVILPPNGKEIGAVGGLNVDRISPDGSMILFRAGGGYYVRRLSSMESEPLPPFVSAGDAFWAPDSQSIAFPAEGGRLMKMRVPKGAPEVIAKDMAAPERGGSWGEKGIVLFVAGPYGLYSVPATGGSPRPVQVAGLKEGHYFNPEFLPGGEDFLFEFFPADSETALVYLATFSNGKAVDPRLLLSNETAAAFTPSGGGRLLFVHNDNLYSQKLDLKARKLSEDPELLQERVASIAGSRNAYFSVSRNGTLAWRSGTAVVSQLTVFDRKGNRTGIAGTPAPVNVIRLSPDESRLATSGEAGSWIVDANGPGRVSLNLGAALSALWSPDSSRIIFIRKTKLLETPLGGSGEPRELSEVPFDRFALLNGVSPDGRRVLIGEGTGLFWFALDGKGAPERVFGQRADNAALSPDGAWIVYHTRIDVGVYAQPVSGASLPRQIAPGGNFAVWRADGKEIIYYDRRNIWSVRVEGSGNAFRFAAPDLLFPVPLPLGLNSASRPLTVNRDGSRIYFLISTEQPDSGVIKVRTGAIQ